MTKMEIKALVIASGNVLGCHIGPVIARKTYDSLLAFGYIKGGETDDAPITLTEQGEAALLDALS